MTLEHFMSNNKIFYVYLYINKKIFLLISILLFCVLFVICYFFLSGEVGGFLLMAEGGGSEPSGSNPSGSGGSGPSGGSPDPGNNNGLLGHNDQRNTGEDENRQSR